MQTPFPILSPATMQLEVFHFDDDRPGFEDFSEANGLDWWLATDLQEWLGYASYRSFKKAINRAMSACANLNVDIAENFIPINRVVDGKTVSDYKLSRFACYLTAMNGDPRKPQVAAAQAYFVAIADALEQYLQEANNVERLLIRGEISEREKSLSGVAKAHDVRQGRGYALFHNAGYRGMYNLNLKQLKARKGVDLKRTLFDFMGKEELAANLFRVTQTEAKIKNENIRGQYPLETAAEQVGRKVRRTMIDISGTRPEDLPIDEDIKDVKKKLKKTQRQFKKLDKGSK